MANDLLSDGNIKVSWVVSIANKSAPTVAELNAGTGLEQEFLTPDGLEISPETGAIDTSSLGSTFSTSAAGRRGFELNLKVKRKTTGDSAHALFTFRAEGFVVVRRHKLAVSAWATGDKVEVYPVQVGELAYDPPEENSVTKYTMPMFLTAEPDTRATVA